jgi:hypothetical protein
MIAAIHVDDVTLVDDHFITEASTVGLPPGLWPDCVVVVGERNTGYFFGPGTKPIPEEAASCGGRIYLNNSGFELHILND